MAWVTWPIFKFWDPFIYFERLKMETSYPVHALNVTSANIILSRLITKCRRTPLSVQNVFNFKCIHRCWLKEQMSHSWNTISLRMNCDLNANEFSLQECQILYELRSELVICCPVKWFLSPIVSSNDEEVLAKVICAVSYVRFVALTPYFYHEGSHFNQLLQTSHEDTCLSSTEVTKNYFY